MTAKRTCIFFMQIIYVDKFFKCNYDSVFNNMYTFENVLNCQTLFYIITCMFFLKVLLM